MTRNPERDADFLLAFDLCPIGLCITRNRVIHRCNPAFAEIFGYAVKELNSRSLELLYPSHEEFEHIGKRGRPIMEKTGSYCDERIMMRGNGDLFWCRVLGRSLNRADPFDLAVWVFEDISARRPVGVGLTGREREIAPLLASGKTSKQIGKALGISPRTVEAYRARLMKKFSVHTAGELISRILGLPP